MKRILKISLILAVLALPVWLIAPQPATAIVPDDSSGAQTQAQADACRKKFDFQDGNNRYKGKTYREGDQALTNFNNDRCFSSRSNCKIKPANDPKTFRVNCTNAPGTNTVAPEVPEEPEYYKDPALAVASACTKDSCDIIAKYVNPAITLLTVVVGLAVVIGIIVGAIQVMTSAGDPQKAANGKDHIRNAVIGIVGYLLLFAFLQFIIPGGYL